MGCITSKFDKVEILQKCKERKRLMKQLVGFRAEFAVAQMAYMRALRNTGITLRQFAEGDSLEFENPPFRLSLPRSPPPPLPPSPPPPPQFSPDNRRIGSEDQIENQEQEECIEIDDDNNSTPPPPLVQSSSWEFWDPFVPSSSQINQKKNGDGVRQAEEDEDWEETKTEFEEEQEDDANFVASKQVQKKSPSPRQLMDDNSSSVSWYTRDTTDMAMVIWRSKKTMASIVKELDDYFLKASEGVKEIGVLLEDSHGSHPQDFGDHKAKNCKSAKVFSSLSWSWSSKSLLSSKDALDPDSANERIKPGALCRTLDKLYSEEQKLYDKLKEEEIFKSQLQKKVDLLQKQENEDQDWIKTEKTRASIESLQSEILSCQESINKSCLCISKLRDQELYPQLLELSSGLLQIWRTMYESHQVQNHIAQQMNHLDDLGSTDPTTEDHRQATTQLEAEVTSWYNTFCHLVSSQRDFVWALYQWVGLTEFLPDIPPTNSASDIRELCEEWQLSLEKLPDKVAADGIKSFISVIHSIVLQQIEEGNLERKSSRLEKRLEKQLNLLSKMEKKCSEKLASDNSSLSPNNPSSVEHMKLKTDALKKKVEEEKAKYLNSVRLSRAMTLNNLQTGLPNVFQAMTGFASVFSQAFEAIHGHAKGADFQEENVQPVNQDV